MGEKGKHLVIVESPAKAKTIQKFLGKNYEVVASYGHIRDLPKRTLGVDVENDFQPHYVILPEKKEVVSELKKKASSAEAIWLATDEDREGEAISWHIVQALKLDPAEVKRIVFHEITKDTILKAIQSPRQINMNLVNAQQARRVLDRLVGYELSPLLWRKIQKGLSAGRVQSVALRLIVEREREIEQFTPQRYFTVKGHFLTADKQTSFKASLNKEIPDQKALTDFFAILSSGQGRISKVQKKPVEKQPPPPFITSTLQQEASRKLGLPVAQVMRLAQNLYEAGHITYMRTDSVHLSEYALDQIRDYLKQTYSQDFDRYYQRRQFQSKSKLAQEAHEAIRPTDIFQLEVSQNKLEQQLYELIWHRTVASQMAAARLERTIVHIDVGHPEYEFLAKGEVMEFQGFLALYIPEEDEESGDQSEQQLPPLAEGEIVWIQEIEGKESYSRPPSRYSEATLVKRLEQLGIGRPSTYAPTISTIIQRGYVERRNVPPKTRTIKRYLYQPAKPIQEVVEEERYGSEKRRLLPTVLGVLVTDYLLEHFPDIMDYQFTARMEDEFDEIARGEKQWIDTLKAFYPHFHQKVEETLKSKMENRGERILGIDPKTQKPVIIRYAKYGPVIQLGAREDPEKRYVTLPKSILMEQVTLEFALKLLSLPQSIMIHEGEPVFLHLGRFGFYLQYQDKKVSIPSSVTNPFELTEEEILQFLSTKKGPIQVFEEGDIQILSGRYGPYIKARVDGKTVNVNIPRTLNPETLTLDTCKKLIQEKLEQQKAGKKKSTRKRK
jgi:DNA topoisomerase-1